MKYTKVNLIRKSEIRYQGAVSGRFLLVCLVVTPIILIAMLSGIKLMQYSEIQTNLKNNRELWTKLKPQLMAFYREKRGYETNQKVLMLIDAWNRSKIPWEDILRQIQMRIPLTIQITRLSIRGETGSGEYTSVGELNIHYDLEIAGLAQGENAESDVIILRRKLLQNETLASVFDSIKLASMRKKPGTDTAPVREFKLQGTGKSGDITDDVSKSK